VNWVVVPGNATCPTLFRGLDRLLHTDAVGGADDSLVEAAGSAGQSGGVVARLALYWAPWRGRGTLASGVAEEEEGIAARADSCEPSTS